MAPNLANYIRNENESEDLAYPPEKVYFILLPTYLVHFIEQTLNMTENSALDLFCHLTKISSPSSDADISSHRNDPQDDMGIIPVSAEELAMVVRLTQYIQEGQHKEEYIKCHNKLAEAAVERAQLLLKNQTPGQREALQFRINSTKYNYKKKAEDIEILIEQQKKMENL